MIKKTKSSPWTILLPLIVAFSVIGVILLNASSKNSTTEIRSRASNDTALTQCTDTCNNPQYARFIKDAGACTLDCTKVVNGGMTCKTFCRNITKSPTARYATAPLAICEQRCKPWSPITAESAARQNRCSTLCDAYEGVGQNSALVNTYRANCRAECALVESGSKTCTQAFPNSGSTMDRQVNNHLRGSCQRLFE